MVTTERSPIEVVRGGLNEYSGKGILRKLEVEMQENGLVATFHWLSTLQPFRLEVDTEDESLALVDFFPTFPPEVEQDALRLLNKMADADTPLHRRVDPEKAELLIAIEEHGPATLLLKVKGGDYDYALRRLINIASEFYHSLQITNAEYAFYAFGGSEE